jgi:hypothetical protein
MKFKWYGKKVFRQVIDETVKPGLRDFGLDVEGESKAELQKGHGVETGTLRRSIHTASPGYSWAADNVPASPGSPERGSTNALPETSGGKLTIQVGSGMSYALPVHQGHHSFSGYHFLTNGLQKARPRLDSHIERHALK